MLIFSIDNTRFLSQNESALKGKLDYFIENKEVWWTVQWINK